MKSKNIFPLLIIPFFTFYCHANDKKSEVNVYAIPALNLFEIQKDKKNIPNFDFNYFPENSYQKSIFSSNFHFVIQNITLLKDVLENINVFCYQKRIKQNKFYTEHTKNGTIICSKKIKTKIKRLQTTYIESLILENKIFQNLIPIFLNEDSHSI